MLISLLMLGCCRFFHLTWGGHGDEAIFSACKNVGLSQGGCVQLDFFVKWEISCLNVFDMVGTKDKPFGEN